MKAIKIIILSAFIIGLVVFQINLTSEQGNPFSKIGMSLTAKAFGENPAGNYYQNKYTSFVCASDYIEQTCYYTWGGSPICCDTRVNNVTTEWCDGGYYSMFTSSRVDRMGSRTSCESGSSTCSPSEYCPN